jgi:hypothetical protein
VSEYLILPILTILLLVACAFLFRRSGVPDTKCILYAFLFLGVVLGLISVFLWPGDLGVYANVPGTAAGDWLYRFSIEKFGNPNSDQAHYSIPWILRIPEVYAVVSPVVYFLLGMPIQFLYSQIKKSRVSKGFPIPRRKP